MYQKTKKGSISYFKQYRLIEPEVSSVFQNKQKVETALFQLQKFRGFLMAASIRAFSENVVLAKRA